MSILSKHIHRYRIHSILHKRLTHYKYFQKAGLMEKRNITFSISNEVIALFEKNVPQDKRSEFIEDMIRSRFNVDLQKKFLDELTEGKSDHGQFLAKMDAAREMAEALQDNDFLSDAELNELDDIL